MSIFKPLSIKIVSFLEKDKLIILSVCFLIITYYSFTRYFLGTDHLLQFGTVVNFINGDGFSIKYFDGEFIYYIERDEWPYFLRFFSLPFLYVTKNVTLSSIVIKILSYVILFLILKLFYKCLFNDQNKTTLGLNITLLFSAFCIAPFNYGNDIDIFSVGGFILSLTMVFYYYQRKSRLLFLYIFFIIIFLVCHMRYAYLPKVLLFLFTIIIYELFNRKLTENFIHKVFLSILSLGNIYFIYTNDYFNSHSESVLSSGFSSMNDISTYWHVLYSPAVNTFIPDHIIYTFLEKISNHLIAHYYLIFITIMMIFSLTFIFKFIKEIKKNNNFLLGFLSLFCVINLIILFLIFGLKPQSFYSQEQIHNASLLSYSGLTVYNRYLLLFHASGFILALYFAIEKKSTFFKKILTLSLIFGFLHSCYLVSRYSFNRNNNLKLISTNPNRYIDCVNTSDFVITELKKNKKILFIPVFELESVEYRKRSPTQIIQSNGGTIFKKFPSENFLLKKTKFNIRDFDRVFYCDFSKNKQKYEKKFHHIYKGNFLSLFEKL